MGSEASLPTSGFSERLCLKGIRQRVIEWATAFLLWPVSEYYTHTLHFCLLFLSSSRKPMRSEFLVHKVYKVCNRFQHTHTKPNYEKNAWISPVNVKLLFQIAETSWRQNLNPSNPVFSAECCLTPSTLQTSSSCGLHLDVRTQGDVGNRKWKDWVFFFFFHP